MDKDVGARFDLAAEAEMVRVQRGRHAFIPAKLIHVIGKNAVVKPMGHKQCVVVPLRTIKPWKSRSRALVQHDQKQQDKEV
jgi:hypothetical protein